MLETILFGLFLIASIMYASERKSNDTIYTILRDTNDAERILKQSAQESLLEFYIADYCEGLARPLLFKGFATEFSALYCDKPAVLLLMDELPIAVIHNTTGK